MTATKLTAGQRLQSELVRAFARAPAPLIAWLGRGAPVNADGERLAPEVYLGLKAHERAGHAGEVDKIAAARRGLDIDALIFSERLEGTTAEEEFSIPSRNGPIAATRYHPQNSRGLLVYFHGGGWVLGSRATHAGVCRFIANEGEVDVVSVEYRLAPENKFPAAVDDAIRAWDWATAVSRFWGIPRDKRVVAGDSAGGNLAAVVAQATRGTPHSPTLQVLFYPATDLTIERDSAREFAQGYQLTLEQMRWFKRLYVRSEADYTDVRASPLLGDPAGVAPAYIAVAGFDPLRDEGLAYAEKLKAAGVPVTLYRAGSMIHGFVNLTAISPDARSAAVNACQAIANA